MDTGEWGVVNATGAVVVSQTATLTRLEALAVPCVVGAFLLLTCTANISNWQPFLSLHTKVNLLGTAFPVAKDRKKALSQALAMRVGFLQSPHSESKTNQTSGSPLQCGD